MSGDVKQIDCPPAAASALSNAHPTPSPFFTCDLKRILCVAALAIACLVGILALARVNGLAQMGNAGGGALLGGGVFFLLIAVWVSRTQEKAKEDHSGSAVKPNAEALQKFFAAFYPHMCAVILAHLPPKIKITKAHLLRSVADKTSGTSHSPTLEFVAPPQNPWSTATFAPLLRFEPLKGSNSVTVECVFVVRDSMSKFHVVSYSNTLSAQAGSDGQFQRYSETDQCDAYSNMDLSGLQKTLGSVKAKLEVIDAFRYEALEKACTA